MEYQNTNSHISHLRNYFTLSASLITLIEDKFIDNTPHGKIEFNNIIVTKDPQAHQKLVLAAHFDSKYFSEFNFIGATDSAAPCGILMHLAKTLNPLLDKRKKNLFDRYSTIQIIFFDGEEAFVDWTATDSIYGARHLAKKWANTMITMFNADKSTTQISPINQIIALILLDLLGTKDSTIMVFQSSMYHFNFTNRIHNLKRNGFGIDYVEFMNGWGH